MGKHWKQWQTLFSWVPKSLQMLTAIIKIKDACTLEEKLWPACCDVLSYDQIFATPWTAAYQASLSITTSRSLFKLMSIESVMPSNHLILSQPLLLPFIFLNIRVFFQMSQFFASGGQSIGVSASASVLPMNIQDWFPLGWTGWIFLQSTGLSRVFSNTIVQKHQFLSTQLSLWSNFHIHAWLLENHSFD